MAVGLHEGNRGASEQIVAPIALPWTPSFGSSEMTGVDVLIVDAKGIAYKYPRLAGYLDSIKEI